MYARDYKSFSNLHRNYLLITFFLPSGAYSLLPLFTILLYILLLSAIFVFNSCILHLIPLWSHSSHLSLSPAPRCQNLSSLNSKKSLREPLPSSNNSCEVPVTSYPSFCPSFLVTLHSHVFFTVLLGCMLFLFIFQLCFKL